MSKADLARDFFLKGANCAQAIACAFADECGQSPEMMAKLASGFGAGMGRMREVCGAVSGMVLVADLLKGPTDLADKAGKDAQYTLIQDLANQFKAQTGSIICRELLSGSGAKEGREPEARTASYYKKRPCPQLVKMAAELADQMLPEHRG